MTNLVKSLSIAIDCPFLQAKVCLNKQTVAVVGATGAGKTTLLKAIVGEIKDGVVLQSMQNNQVCNFDNDKATLVHSSEKLFTHLTVAKNLQLVQSCNPSSINFNQIVVLFEIESLLTKQPQQLSSGQTQLVVLARAMLSAPKVLLLDESLSSLDKPTSLRILTKLLDYTHKYQIQLIVVTHNLTLLLQGFEQILVVDKGQIAVSGALDQVLQSPNWLQQQFQKYAWVSSQLLSNDATDINNHRQQWLPIPMQQLTLSTKPNPFYTNIEVTAVDITQINQRQFLQVSSDSLLHSVQLPIDVLQTNKMPQQQLFLVINGTFAMQ